MTRQGPPPPAPDMEPSGGVERIGAFSDALFAFAMTLLVINVALPPGLPDNLSNEVLSGALVGIVPNVLGWLISFFSVGLYWVAHHRVFQYIRRADSILIWLNLLLLLSISLTPFTSSIVMRYGNLRVAWMVFATVMTLVGVLSSLLWNYATRNRRLVSDDLDPRLVRYYQLRGVAATAVFASSIGVSYLSVPAAEAAPFLIIAVQFLIRRRFSARPRAGG